MPRTKEDGSHRDCQKGGDGQFLKGIIMIAEHRIQTMSPGQLQPYPRNARTHSKKQIRQIAESITRFGFTNPVLIDEAGMILAGHGRVEAAKLLGLEQVPCLRFDHMSAAEKRAYILADNRLALNAGWDEDLLADELKSLLAEEIDFDIGITGFSIAEVDKLIEDQVPEEAGDPADDLLASDAAVRCAPGDLWQLGTVRGKSACRRVGGRHPRRHEQSPHFSVLQDEPRDHSPRGDDVRPIPAFAAEC
jgi:hypothetical protein